MVALRIKAGSVAAARLRDEGLRPDQIRMVLGASGGPKWLVLAGLDNVLFGDWLPKAEHAIDLIGSSIGAWRMAAACHPETKRIFERLRYGYFRYRYTKGDTPRIISEHTEKVLHEWIDDSEKAKIVANPMRRLHIVTTRSKGLMTGNNRFSVGLGLFFAGISVLLARRFAAWHFERYLFSHDGKIPAPDQWSDFPTDVATVTTENLAKVILASGAIPGVNLAERDIIGAKKGVYRDGGFIDYHFDNPFKPADGLVLYPHFYGYCVPGWFDKLRGRRTSAETLSHTVLLYPDETWVKALPGGKIPDRNDFINLDNDTRIERWKTVMQRSEELASDFMELAENPSLLKSKLETFA